MSGRKRIAWISPISNRSTTASAYFSRNLLPTLASELAFEVFVDDSGLKGAGHSPVSSFSQLRGGDSETIPIHHYHRLELIHGKQPFDFFVYHFEDSAECAYVQKIAQLHPGICFFHDLRLNRLYQSRILHTTAAKDFNDLMDEHFGAESVRLGEYHMRGWSVDVFDRMYPLGQSDIEQSPIAVTVNQEFCKELLSHGSNRHCYFIPPCVDLSQNTATSCDRASLGIGSSDFVIGFSGDCSSSQHVHEVFESCAMFLHELSPSERERVRLLWMREGSLSDLDIQRKKAFFEMLHGLLPNDVIEIFEGDISSRESVAECCDVFLCVETDDARGLSADVIRAMLAGCCCILSESSACSELSSSSVLTVPRGQAMLPSIARTLVEVFSSPVLREQISASSRTFCREHFSPESASQKFLSLLTEVRESCDSAHAVMDEKVSRAQNGLIAASSGTTDEAILTRARVDFAWDE